MFRCLQYVLGVLFCGHKETGFFQKVAYLSYYTNVLFF